ncbi:expressed unknown protein [Seminavis robusta]|uniref:Uncharacterized protein n=1 Tax=Seminavis robusta TaxID=568900 RepID=A0A9N8E850_9STRA|nr:expressed unknown protein [Seminavis robusta]|eukprot:Sro788_g202440.1 n/a (266) ;mRNA; f:345-1142
MQELQSKSEYYVYGCKSSNRRNNHHYYGLRFLSDFEIVQVALIDQDNIEEALERIYKLQAFRQEYDCVSSCVEAHGQDAIQRCMDLFPGLLLSVSYQASLGNHVFASDLTKLYRSIVESSSSSEDMTAVVLVACYVVFQATNPDFESMRQGVVLLAECGGFCWTKNFKLSLFQKFWVELGGVYPMKLKKLRHFHTSMFFNLLQSMGRPFLPKDVKEAFEIGCCSVLGRLDNVYLSPSVAAANARFKRRIKVCLQTRQENASSFKL